MRVGTDAGIIDLGLTEATPTISINDFSRRVTDDFGVTTVVERSFARRLSVRFAFPFANVDALQRRLAVLRATSALWIADDRFDCLSVQGFYKDLAIDLNTRPISFCTLSVEGLPQSQPPADIGGEPAAHGQASTLMVIDPVAIGDGVLTASNIAEDDQPAWAAGTDYAIGANVIRGHRVWEAVKASKGDDPTAASGAWLDTGPTNRFAMFDQALGTSTTGAGSIAVTVAASVDAVALLDVVGSTVRVQAVGYDRTINVGTDAILFLDMPAVTEATITIAGPGQVSVGTLLVGRLGRLGITEASPTVGINDFSRKDTDDFGETTIVERGWAKRVGARSLIRTDAIDQVFYRLAAVRARPVLWIGDVGTDALTVYGFFKDMAIEVGTNVSKLSLTIEGLSKASPAGKTVKDQLDEIVDDVANLEERVDEIAAGVVELTGAALRADIATRSIDEMVADGQLIYFEQERIYRQLVNDIPVEINALKLSAQRLALDTAPVDAAYKAVFDFFLAIPGFAENGNPTQPVDAAQWAILRNALRAAMGALQEATGNITAGLTPIALADWTFTGFAMTGAAGKGVGSGQTKNSYLSPQLVIKLKKGRVRVVFANVDNQTETFGFVLTADTKRIRFVNGAAEGPDYTDETWPDGATVRLAMYDSGATARMNRDVAESVSAGNGGVVGLTAGERWAAAIVGLDAASEFEIVSFHAAAPIQYSGVVGGPPADATPGSNVSKGDQWAAGIDGPDGEGYYTFDGQDLLHLTGNYADGHYLPYRGEEYLHVSAAKFKDFTGAGTAYIIMQCMDAGGSTIAGPPAIPIKEGEATVAFPIGLAKYRVFVAVSFTSGSIKIDPKSIVLTPRTEAQVDNSKVLRQVDSDGKSTLRYVINNLYPFGDPRASAGGYGSGEIDPLTPAMPFVALIEGEANAPSAFFSSTYNTKFIALTTVRGAYRPSNDHRAYAPLADSGLLFINIDTRNSKTSEVVNVATIDVTPIPFYPNNAIPPEFDPERLKLNLRETFEIPAGHDEYRVTVTTEITGGQITLGLPDIKLRRLRQVDNQVAIDVLTKPVDVPAPQIDRPPSYYLTLQHQADPSQVLSEYKEKRPANVVGLSPSDTGDVEIATTVNRSAGDAELRSVRQTATYGGVNYYRTWDASYGDAPNGSAWATFVVPGKPFTSSGWAEVFSGRKLPKTTDLTTEAGVPLNDPAVVTAIGTAAVAEALLDGGDLAFQDTVDYETQTTGPKPPVNADKTTTNIPFGIAPLYSVAGGGFISPTTPFIIYNPRFKGENVSQYADWSFAITDGLVGAGNNSPGSVERGLVILTKMLAMLGYVRQTSIYQGEAYTTLSRIEKTYPIINDVNFEPGTMQTSVGIGYQGAVTLSSLDWTPIVRLDPKFNQGTGLSYMSFQATAMHTVQAMADNSVQVEYKSQAFYNGGWNDVESIGTSGVCYDYSASGSRFVATGNLNITNSNFARPSTTMRAVARLTGPSSPVVVKAASVGTTGFPGSGELN